MTEPTAPSGDNDPYGLMKRMQEAGCGIDDDDGLGDSPYLWAVENWNDEALEWLLAAGVDVNHHGPSQKITAMQHAALFGNLRAMKWLHRHGAALQGYNGLEEPLHIAVSAGKLHIVQWLVQEGVDINLMDHEGKTALYYSEYPDEDYRIGDDNESLVQWLKANGGKY